ncbi:MAG: hypothetical protein LAT57_02180 [Balneolales bacterium]|nr:hypothetical protein [Balneolales bacterium]
MAFHDRGSRQRDALRTLASQAETLAERSGNIRKVSEIARALCELAENLNEFKSRNLN